METERRLYTITKGVFSRMEEGEHRVYSAKVTSNMDGKNEVYLTDEEANKFGRHRLKEIHGRGIRTQKTEILTPPVGKTNDDEEGNDQVAIGELIAMGEESTGAAAARRFREAVINAGVLDDVPSKKNDILEALRNLTN